MDRFNYYELTDEELLNYLEGPNRKLIEQILLKRYQFKIYKRCYSYVRDESLSRDFTQDIMIKVLDKISGFRRTAKFSTWVYAITVNHCIDYARRKSKGEIIDFISSSQIPDVIEDLLPDNETEEPMYDRFIEVLESLPENHQRLIRMRYLENMSVSDISLKLGIKSGAAKMRIKRAREALILKYFEKYGNRLLNP
ncbi:MAG: RNA polymerase sigma factor [Bacteroidales bacterium]